MSKIVLVETVSSFRHVHAVELPDDAPDDWAIEDVISEITKDDPDMSEVGQKWIGEEIFSHRVVDGGSYRHETCKEHENAVFTLKQS